MPDKPLTNNTAARRKFTWGHRDVRVIRFGIVKATQIGYQWGVTGDPPGSFGGLVNLGKKKAAYLP